MTNVPVHFWQTETSHITDVQFTIIAFLIMALGTGYTFFVLYLSFKDR
jgi:hypothetical protein